MNTAPGSMYGPVPTVRIVSKEKGHVESGGYVEINESDFDPSKHEKWVESGSKPASVQDEFTNMDRPTLELLAKDAKITFQGNTKDETLRAKLREAKNASAPQS
jgi:hypothetical protein